jgi:cell division septation protein DedD
MKILNKMKFLVLLLIILLIQFLFTPLTKVFAATSPTLGTDLTSFSVLGGQAVTCTGSTTASGGVGVSSGTSITGFPSPCTAGGGTHSNDASAIAAQANNLAVFGILDQTCDQTFGAVDLTATFPSGVGPGVYCSTSSFTLTKNLNLTGSGVWIFKTVSTIITSPGSSVTGGDPCNVWWRIGSSATLDTTTSFIGNILALNGVTALKTGATLNGRVLAQDAGTITLDSNTITGPNCATTPSPTPSPSATPSASPSPSPSPSPSSTPESTPSPTSSPSNTGSTSSSGGGSSSSSNSNSGGQVSGASTGQQVLGLSTTSSDNSPMFSFIQLAAAFGFVSLGFGLFRKNQAFDKPSQDK